MRKVRWGILSTAKIGTEQVIPAMQQGRHSEIVAISSRTLEKAQFEAERLGIPAAYGSYQELLDDPEVEAVYNPLPNHMHVSWSVRALDKGKHVLCEKPIAMSSVEADELVAAARANPHLKVMEAFMYRHHPQWLAAVKLIREGQIGALKTVQSFFSYFNEDPENIRNIKEMGGGGLMDIGCYPISVSRLVFGAEPVRAFGVVDFDPRFQTDHIASAILQFGEGTSSFTCSTQLTPYQRVHLLGDRGRIEIEIPFNAPPDNPCRIWLQKEGSPEEIEFETCDQYTAQGDVFSKAILEDTDVPTPISDAAANMRVIEALFKSGKLGTWVNV
jgi:predicted dehydrogenase